MLESESSPVIEWIMKQREDGFRKDSEDFGKTKLEDLADYAAHDRMQRLFPCAAKVQFSYRATQAVC
jgi:hypothetical protein